MNINKKDMLSRFPFAHCHFRTGNSLLLDEFTFLKKILIFFSQNTGKFLTGEYLPT